MKNCEIFEFVKQYDNFEDFEKQYLSKNRSFAENMVLAYHFDGNFLRDYVAYTGAIENKKGGLIKLTREKFYEENINVGNKEGGADLKFRNKKDDTWLLYSCKIFTHQGRTRENLDIPKLINTRSSLISDCNIKEKIELSVICNYPMEKINSMFDNSPKKDGCINKNHIVDRKELEKIFLNLKKMSYTKSSSCIYKPRFYQKYFINNITEDFKTGTKNILLDSLPRTGKTFMCLQIVNNLKPRNVLFISNIKTNIKDGLRNELERNLDSEYKRYDYDIDALNENYEENSFNFISTTFQSLKSKNLPFEPDLIIIDESHLGILGPKNQKLLQEITNKNTKILFMSGTCNKTIQCYPDLKVYSFGLESVKKLKVRDKDEISLWEDKIGTKILESELNEGIDIFPDICFADICINKEYKKSYFKTKKEVEDFFSNYENMFVVKNKKFTKDKKKRY